MAFCGDYQDMRKSNPHGASDMSDDRLLFVITQHRKKDFWKTYRAKPNQYAYVRRWAGMVRLEARRRGLL